MAVAGKAATTIEGIGGAATGDALHPVEQALLDHDGYRCGYCTPGQICSAVAVLDEHAAGWPSAVTGDVGAEEIVLDEPEIRERMSGNLCRCEAHVSIVAAVADAAGARP
ncbi:2Fe-2S iron-sulfur cluster-binding protein [Pseudonocardia sp.]|uniref:2Fe-2S iron-sulfur cluster-binding protein n=1 Tax=Pseudonocardia sp. TaxID=60912 RepID=UPI0031FD0021